MKLLIEIPKEFEEHFNMDRFEDSLERIRADIQYGLENYSVIAGLYELEFVEMLRDTMIKAEVIKE